MDSSALDLQHLKAWESLIRAHGALIKAICQRMGEKCEIGLDTYEVLLSLEQAPQRRLTMGGLADIVMLSPSGVTRLVDRLQRDGFLERVCNPSDKRSFYAVLTPMGLAAREKAWPTVQECIREVFASKLSEQEAETLTKLLLKFVKSGVGAKVYL